MVDAWVKNVLENGSRNYIAMYNLNFTATTPLTGYTAADPTSSGDMGVAIGGNVLYPGSHLKIWKMQYNMSASQALKITWDATTDDIALTVNGNGGGIVSFKKDPGGLYNPKSTGVTGKVLFDTVGTPAVGDFISIEVWYKKDIAQ